MILDKIKSLFQKTSVPDVGFSKLIESMVRFEVKDCLEAYISDVNDEKSKYLKQYLETKMRNNALAIAEHARDISRLNQQVYKIFDDLERIEEKFKSAEQA